VGCLKDLVCDDGAGKVNGDGDGGVGGKGGKKVRVELWFSLLPALQRKGLATEAVEAFVREVVRREREGGEVEMELEIECDPRNTGSRRLAERLGFRKESEVEEAFECKGEMVGSVVYRKVV
jgi:RimJ/RimL family protein N-acetyltransferase